MVLFQPSIDFDEEALFIFYFEQFNILIFLILLPCLTLTTDLQIGHLPILIPHCVLVDLK